VLNILDSVSIFPLTWGTTAESVIVEQSAEPVLCLSVFSANIYYQERMRTNLENEGISDKAFKIILASWRSSTKKTICYIHQEMALVF
jgi:hypothetical protein